MILIFGGTTEGRLAVEVCEEAGKVFYYSTKSNLQFIKMHNGVRLNGAMNTKDIIAFCEEKEIKCVIDAAHPFAENLHRSIMDTGMPVIRLLRNFSNRRNDVVYCKNFSDAVEKMSASNIRCLLALTGVNTIAKLDGYWKHHKTIVRILRRNESIETALASHFPTSNLIFYNDGVSLPTEEEERTLMRKIGCDAIITKESGESGGFNAKVNAAISLGIKVFVIEHPMPSLPQGEIRGSLVTGKYGLRRAIEKIVPEFFPLKTGYTTGACATAATKAALLSLLFDEVCEEISFSLPDKEIMSIPVSIDDKGCASVIKDHSDDPDVTKGCKITSRVELREDNEIVFLQGKGVGTVTLPGLGIPVGGPAINPTPRKMIEDEIRQITDKGVTITISVENGEELAKKTFNSKVGVLNGISIIGTSGIVSPLSNDAFIQSITRELEVAKAIGCDEVALVSGKRSEEAIKEAWRDKKIRCIHYGNFIGDSLQAAHRLGFKKVVLVTMIGKAVKLAEGHLNTHSHNVVMNKAFLKSIAGENAGKIDNIVLARELWQLMPPEFFHTIRDLCYKNCISVFPNNKLEVILIDEQGKVYEE